MVASLFYLTKKVIMRYASNFLAFLVSIETSRKKWAVLISPSSQGRLTGWLTLAYLIKKNFQKKKSSAHTVVFLKVQKSILENH